MLKHIRENILGEIIIEDDLIMELIYSKDLQRLKNIKQLAATYFLYPSAEHSRFIHSLGVYEIARRIVSKLDIKISDREKKAILSASLLHDIGHGPFSHVFENTFMKIKHEKLTVKILNDKNSDVNKILNKHDKSIIKEISLIIEGKHPTKWFNQLLSSEIDVDRIDYLLRDNNLANSGYVSFNIDWLVNSFNIKDDEIVFSYNSLSTLEDFLIGRYHMFKNVYDHPRDISFTIILNFLKKRMDKLIQDKYKFKTKCKKNYRNFNRISKLSYDDFFEMTDIKFIDFINNIKREDDHILKRIAESILNGKLLNVFDLEDKNEKILFLESKKNLNNNYEYTIYKMKNSFYDSEKGIKKIRSIKILKDNKIHSIDKFSTFINPNVAKGSTREHKFGYILP